MKDIQSTGVIVTGAGGLLGHAFTKRLVASGRHVIAIDVDTAALKRLEEEFDPREITVIDADITDFELLRHKLTPVLDQLEVVGLVNNAAINPQVEAGLPRLSDALNVSWESWSFEFKVGILGAVNCSRLLASHFLDHGKPSSVVNLSSDYGHLGPEQSLYEDGSDNPPIKPLPYTVIKHATVGLTRHLATLWTGTNIRVNALAPGGVENGQNEQFVRRLSSRVPLGRMAKVEEISSVCEFLISSDSTYVNGVEIVVDGGRSAW